MDLVSVAQGYVLLGFMCLCCDQWVLGNSAVVHTPLCSGETMKEASLPQQLLAGLAYHTEMAALIPAACVNVFGWLELMYKFEN